MKYITILTSVIKRVLSKDVVNPVGRWRIENCNIKMNNKVDLSNEDHCGPCGQYVLQQIESKNKHNTDFQAKDKQTEKL